MNKNRESKESTKLSRYFVTHTHTLIRLYRLLGLGWGSMEEGRPDVLRSGAKLALRS